MPNGLSNGKTKQLPDDLYFTHLDAGNPAARALVESGFKLKTYLGAAAAGDVVIVVRSFLAAVRQHVLHGAALVAVSSLDLLDLCMPEVETPAALSAFYATLPRYRRLTAPSREALINQSHQTGWLAEQVRNASAPERIDTSLLVRTAAPEAVRLVELYQDFVDCRIKLLTTAVCYPRCEEDWVRPYREINLVDFVNFHIFRDESDDEAGDDKNIAPENEGGA